MFFNERVSHNRINGVQLNRYESAQGIKWEWSIISERIYFFLFSMSKKEKNANFLFVELFHYHFLTLAYTWVSDFGRLFTEMSAHFSKFNQGISCNIFLERPMITFTSCTPLVFHFLLCPNVGTFFKFSRNLSCDILKKRPWPLTYIMQLRGCPSHFALTGRSFLLI